MRKISSIAAILPSLALAALVFPSATHAGGGCSESSQGVAAHIFESSDANADGFLSPAEFTAAGLERYGVAFEAFDANKDGVTSADEYFDLFDAHHPPRDAAAI